MNVNWQPHLENDLLILRPLKAEDFDALFKVASVTLSTRPTANVIYRVEKDQR